jgi:hypothetical protein
MVRDSSVPHKNTAATQHDAEEEAEEDVWPARLTTGGYRQLPLQQGAMSQQPGKRVITVYELPANMPLRSSRTMTTLMRYRQDSWHHVPSRYSRATARAMTSTGRCW